MVDPLSSLENLYISPLELCNLNCQYCYTTKTKNILSNSQILDFIDRYQKIQTLKSVIFCGGEVFTLTDFPDLVNQLNSQGVFVSVITNGTIDRLDKIKDPRNCQLIVSFDGPQPIHDHNRGLGNFDKSIKFIEHAQSLDFPVEIFFLITKESYPYKDAFNVFNLHQTYLNDRLNSLTPEQSLDIKKNYPTYPPKNLGCYQISLQSNGLIYGCCETNKSIGKISDPANTIIKRYLDSFSPCQKCHSCLGCCDPEFLCGYKKELSQLSCKQVVKSFNEP